MSGICWGNLILRMSVMMCVSRIGTGVDENYYLACPASPILFSERSNSD